MSTDDTAAHDHAGEQPSETDRPEDPVTARARMTVGEYRGSSYFGQDHRDLWVKTLGGFSLLAVCAVFSIPWALVREPLQIAGVIDAVHVAVAWGAIPIYLLAFAAVAHTRLALADFGVNLAIARHVERSAALRLQEIRRDPSTRGAVSRLESDHLPDNPANPKPAAIRLFQRICAEAMDRRFESTINLIEPYQRESMEPVLKLEGVQRVALRWGILCHFIGLVLVINAVPAMLRGGDALTAHERPAQAVAAPGAAAQGMLGNASTDAAVEELLRGLRLAFGASVGGLSVSIFAAMLLSTVRKRQFAYFRKLDEATSTMVSLATNSLNNDELLASLQHVSARLQEQTLAVREGIQALATVITSQARTIDSGLQSLGDAKARLDTFLDSVARSHDAFLSKLKSFHDVDAIRDAAARLCARIDEGQHRTEAMLASELGDLRRIVSCGPAPAANNEGPGRRRTLASPRVLTIAALTIVTLGIVLWRFL